ncbi:hypothetical protein NA56DRAFT_269663 [Hyaloscypha hepaticicola]|uniref:Uncharacterized protein n=1 Tax=Hyaloscypha hepaticicola TaxID=2082293 RepID=A0A2J6PTZ5_9HELO|nr:hypothetical protein NA56DRAFT_269663 [Hyaloscypha hepaticicola]
MSSCASHFRGCPPCIGSMFLQGACHFVIATLRVASAKDSVTATATATALKPFPLPPWALATERFGNGVKRGLASGCPSVRGAWQHAIRGLGEVVKELTGRHPRCHVETSMMASICTESPDTTRCCAVSPGVRMSTATPLPLAPQPTAAPSTPSSCLFLIAPLLTCQPAHRPQ